MISRRRGGAVAGAALLGTIATVERAAARAARSVAAPGPPADGSRPAVVALGYPSRADGRVHPVQRWRVEMALRTCRAHDAALLVFCGGAVRNDVVEAETMAALASRDAPWACDIRTETRSRSTRENAALVHPMVAGYSQVLLVSDPHHVRRALARWLELHPGDAGRVFGGDTYRLGERWWLKAASAGFERVLARRHRRAARTGP